MMQEFAPDLVLADYVFVGGSALADKLNIPKAIVSIPGLMQPIMSYDFGSGSHLLATSPQWQMLHSRNMVRHHWQKSRDNLATVMGTLQLMLLVHYHSMHAIAIAASYDGVTARQA